MIPRDLRNLGYELPVLGAGGDGVFRAPFADELVRVGRGELLFRVAVLEKDEGAGGGLEVGGEGEDVGEGGGGHGEESVLHVDDEEGGGHDGQVERA